MLDDREGIWSIPRWLQLVYFPIFIGLCTPIIMDIVQEARTSYPEASWVRLARETAGEFATAGVGAAIGTLIAVQGVATIMSLYQYITNRFTKPVIEGHEARGEAIGEARGEAIGEARGEARGKAEANQAWAEWNERRMEAEAQGLLFDEPTPGQEQPQA